MTPAELQEAFPWIAWKEPVLVTSPYGTGYACRLCIAAQGLKAKDTAGLPQTPDECKAHIIQEHGE